MEEGVGSEVEPIRAEMKDGVAASGGFVPSRYDPALAAKAAAA